MSFSSKCMTTINQEYVLITKGIFKSIFNLLCPQKLFFQENIEINIKDHKSLSESHQSFKSKKSVLEEIEEEYLKIFQLEIAYFQEAVIQYRKMKLKNKQFIESFFQGTLDINQYKIPKDIKEKLLSRQRRLSNDKFKFSQFLNPLLKQQLKMIVEQNKKDNNKKKSLLQEDKKKEINQKRRNNKRTSLHMANITEQQEGNFKQEQIIPVEYNKEKFENELTGTIVEQIDERTKILKKQELQKVELEPSNKLPLMQTTRIKRKTTARRNKKPDLKDENIDLENQENIIQETEKDINNKVDENLVDQKKDTESNSNIQKDQNNTNIEQQKVDSSKNIKQDNQNLIEESKEQQRKKIQKQTKKENDKKNLKTVNSKSKSQLKNKKDKSVKKDKKTNMKRSDSWNLRQQKKMAEKNDKSFNKMILKNVQKKTKEYFISMEDTQNQQNIQKVTDSRIQHTIDEHGSLDFDENDKSKKRQQKNSKTNKDKLKKPKKQKDLTQQNAQNKSKSALKNTQTKSKSTLKQTQTKSKSALKKVQSKSKSGLKKVQSKVQNTSRSNVSKKNQTVNKVQNKSQKIPNKDKSKKKVKLNFSKSTAKLKNKLNPKNTANIKKAKSVATLRKNKQSKKKFQASTNQIQTNESIGVNTSLDETNFKTYNAFNVDVENEDNERLVQTERFDNSSKKNNFEQTLPFDRPKGVVSFQIPNNEGQNITQNTEKNNEHKDKLVSFRNFDRPQNNIRRQSNMQKNENKNTSQPKSVLLESSNKNIFLYPKQKISTARSFDKNFQIQQDHDYNIFSQDDQNSVQFKKPHNFNTLKDIKTNSLNFKKTNQRYSIGDNYSLQQFLDTTSFKSQDLFENKQQKQSQVDQMTLNQSLMQSSNQNQDINKMLLEQNMLLINQLIQDKEKMSRMYESLQSQMDKMSQNFQEFKDKDREPIIIKQTDTVTNNNYVEKHLLEETQNNNIYNNDQQSGFSNNDKKSDNNKDDQNNRQDRVYTFQNNPNQNIQKTTEVQTDTQLQKKDLYLNDQHENFLKDQQNQNQSESKQDNEKVNVSDQNQNTQQHINSEQGQMGISNQYQQQYLLAQQQKLSSDNSQFGTYLDVQQEGEFKNPYSHLQSVQSETNNRLDQIQEMLESLNRISQNEEENISDDLLKSDHKMFQRQTYTQQEQIHIDNQKNQQQNNDLTHKQQKSMDPNVIGYDNKLQQDDTQKDTKNVQKTHFDQQQIKKNQQYIINNTIEKNNLSQQQHSIQTLKDKKNRTSENTNISQNNLQQNDQINYTSDDLNNNNKNQYIVQTQSKNSESKKDNQKQKEQQYTSNEQFKQLEENKFFQHFYENILKKETNFDKELDSFKTERIVMSKKSKLQFIYYMIQRLFMKIIVYSSKIQQLKKNEGLDNIVEEVFKKFAHGQNFWGFLEFNNFIDSLQYHLNLQQRKRVFYYFSQINNFKQNHISMIDFKRAFGNVKANQQGFFVDDQQKQKDIQKRDFHIMRRLVIFYLKKYEDIARIVKFLNLLSLDLIFYLITGELQQSQLTRADLKNFFIRNEMYIIEEDYALVFKEFYCTEYISKQEFLNYLKMNIFKIREQNQLI